MKNNSGKFCYGEFLYYDMKYEHWQEDGGDSACPPIPPLRFVIKTYYLFEGLLHFGGKLKCRG